MKKISIFKVFNSLLVINLWIIYYEISYYKIHDLRLNYVFNFEKSLKRQKEKLKYINIQAVPFENTKVWFITRKCKVGNKSYLRHCILQKNLIKMLIHHSYKFKDNRDMKGFQNVTYSKNPCISKNKSNKILLTASSVFRNVTHWNGNENLLLIPKSYKKKTKLGRHVAYER